VQPASKHDTECPCALDEITASVKVYQDRGDVFEPFQDVAIYTKDYDCQFGKIESPLVTRVLESLKRGEKAEFTVIAALFNNLSDEDSFKDEILPKLLPSYDPSKNLYLSCELKSLMKVEDWYKDGTTMVKVLRKGAKGRSPYADSTIKCKFLFFSLITMSHIHITILLYSATQCRSERLSSLYKLPAAVSRLRLPR